MLHARSLTRLSFALILSAALAGCARPADPQAAATAALPAPTVAPEQVAPTLPPATEVPAATEPPAPAPTEVQPDYVAAPGARGAEPLPVVEGQVVLSLPAGSAPGQIGVSGAAGSFYGPPSFRIGADGSIRLLDALNRRVVFYTPAGKLARALAIAEAGDPVDFIVNNAGDVFVYDRGAPRDDGMGYTGQQVLRYGPSGILRDSLPVSDAIRGDALMLTADQHLVLALGNELTYLISHDGEPVPPQLQPATRQRGAATPRSPVLFRVEPQDGGFRLDLDTAYSSRPVNNDWRPLAVPADEATFFNVDRAMNLYLTGALDGPMIAVRRLAPDGSALGGARIDVAACAGHSWHTFYVDQEGAAWTLCSGEAGVTVRRYDLLDQAGQPLPTAPDAAADVPWRPGAVQNVAA